MHEEDPIEEIAIIGMAGRFPGAKNIHQFWDNLANGVESITRFSNDELRARGVSQHELDNPHYVKAGTLFDDAEMFDASFFGYNQHEAEIMDPQQRVFLELSWNALESAGYNPDTCNCSIGVFAGTSGNDYRKRLPANHKSITSGMDSFEVMMGNDADFLTTRVSYKLNLKGPSFTIQTACSTSLVAVHQACQSLLTWQCDMALAGGVCIRFPQGQGYRYQEGMIWSPDGHCRPFDAKAQGTLFGQGAGIVVLKRLSEAQKDNDTILAVIKGSAINNDGAMKVGFTAPSVEGQAEAISTAMALGEIEADTIGYIEAHGTGTPIGDPIEVASLTQAFRESTSKNNYCALGSVKSNIGHLDTAAGIAGLIKTVLALQHKKIPATLHFTEPNPNIDFAATPFYVNNTLQDWQNNGHPRRAGVSSFGIGGTNAHVVIEEAPATQPEPSSRSWHLLPLSAKSESSLHSLITNLTDHINTHPDLCPADIAWTLQQGRKPFKHRSAIVIKHDSREITPAAEDSIALPSDPDIVFMFSGQGSQYVNMGRELYQEYPVFKKQVDLCSEILLPHLNLDLRDILYPTEEKSKEAARQINQTYITQPALFTIEYALAALWNHFGITPAALVGHSIGEYTAACIAGVYSLEDALKLVAARGSMMQSLPPGAMLAIPLSQQDVQPYLSPEIALAVINSATMSVVSGETEHIDQLAQILSEQGIEGRTLRTSHAFHSPMMEPILEEFSKEVEKTTRHPPKIPFVSNVTGTWITETQAQDPAYWAKHMRRTVNFFANAETLLSRYPQGTLLEVGPGQTLKLFTMQHPSSTKNHTVLASTRRPVERKNDIQYFLGTLGKLWAVGSQVKWENFHENEKRRRIALPTYPFDRKRCWLQNDQETTVPNTQQPCRKEIPKNSEPNHKHLQDTVTELENTIKKIWLSIIPGLENISPKDSFYDLGGESLQAVQMLARLEQETGIKLGLGDLEQAPTLDEFVQRAEQIASAGAEPTAESPPSGQDQTEENSQNQQRLHVVKKLIKALGSPAKNIPRVPALIRGTYYIFKYRLTRKNVHIKFPFLAHTKLDIQGSGRVEIDRWCGVYPNGLEHVTITTLNKESTVEIGQNCDLAGVTIRCHNHIQIGNRVLTARNLIQDFFLSSPFDGASKNTNRLQHNRPDCTVGWATPTKTQKTSLIVIADDAWLAMQSTVLAGGNVGRGGVLAAQAVLYETSVEEDSLGTGNLLGG